MLTEERFAKIVKIVNQEGTVTVLELAQAIGISESTIRRDLNQLDKLGRIRKVHGGATAAVLMSDGHERNMQEKYSRNIEEKRAIAAYAATLVHPNDFVFLDPPYDSEFSTYAKNEFDRGDQARLADYLIKECKDYSND